MVPSGAPDRDPFQRLLREEDAALEEAEDADRAAPAPPAGRVALAVGAEWRINVETPAKIPRIRAAGTAAGQ